MYENIHGIHSFMQFPNKSFDTVQYIVFVFMKQAEVLQPFLAVLYTCTT